MSPRLALPRVHGPGSAWLPPTLKRREYWRIVGRFALLGPLIGGLPYNWLIITIPLSYLYGFVPAVVAGLLYAAWWTAPAPRAPTWPWRAAVSAICAAAGCAVFAFAISPRHPASTWPILAWHGVPAAVVLALITGKRAAVMAAAPATRLPPRV